MFIFLSYFRHDTSSHALVCVYIYAELDCLFGDVSKKERRPSWYTCNAAKKLTLRLLLREYNVAMATDVHKSFLLFLSWHQRSFLFFWNIINSIFESGGGWALRVTPARIHQKASRKKTRKKKKKYLLYAAYFFFLSALRRFAFARPSVRDVCAPIQRAGWRKKGGV